MNFHLKECMDWNS